MNFEIVKERNTYLLRIFSLFAAITIFLLWFLENKIAFIIIPIIQFIPLIISPSYYFKTIGNISFGPDFIDVFILERTKYVLDDKIKLKLIYDSQKTSSYYNGFIVKGFVMRIQIENNEDNFREYKFLIKKKDRNTFIKILESLYLKGIPIKEIDEYGSKLFLLRTGYTYKEIQEIKFKYKVIW